MTLTFDLVKG